MTGAPLLDVQDLSVTVRTDDGVVGILDHVSLEVEQGQVMGLVGESGCGKSTLVKAILGILPKGARISTGRIGFGDRDLATLSQRQLMREIRGRRIALIPQDPMQALNPLFTIGTQLLDILKAHFNERDGEIQFRDRCIEMLGRVRLPDPEAALRRYPHQLSGGQRQRVAIAAALLCEPDIILADEPTTALDVTTQSQILALLHDLTNAMSLTIVFVTHDFGVVSQICSHVTVMYAGQTVETGDRRSVLRDPRHPYTRALIDCHPDLQQQLVGIPGSVPSVHDRPSGCRFHPRCAHARPECATRTANLVDIGGNRKIDCILGEVPP